MKAEEVKASKLFDSGQQLRVPIWQRRYSWEKSEWSALLADIQRVSGDDDRYHFVGSVVLRAESWSGEPSHSNRYDIVDGQQRLTTLTLLFLAVRDQIALKPGAEGTADAYNGQLFVNSDKAEGHRRRLVLQETDDPNLAAILEGNPDKAEGLVLDAYNYYFNALRGKSVEELKSTVKIVQTRLDAVWVTLTAEDNAHRVFQTINAGGRPLRQTDLVRNFFFLLLGERGEDFYRQHWSLLEERFDAAELARYFSAWTTIHHHAGSSQGLFGYFNKDLANREGDTQAVWDYGETLVARSGLFTLLTGASTESHTEVQRELVRLQRWGIIAAESLCFMLFTLREDGRLSSDALAESLRVVYSFFARRFLAGYQPNLHRSILRQATHRLAGNETASDDEIVLLLKVILSRGTERARWPDDDAMLSQADVTPIYSSSRARWTKSVLDLINAAEYSNPKFASELGEEFTVEHVMPQDLTADWINDLRSWGVENVQQMHQGRVHTLGNLTLSVVNSELSNKRFATKIALIEHDTLRLNQEIRAATTWTPARIEERGRSLMRKACDLLVPPLTPAEIESTIFASESALESESDEDGDEG